MTKPRIWLSSPHMGGAELEYVREAFESNWVAPVGPHLTAFEDELCRYNDARYCVALSSGTAAIHLALILLGVEKGDEVICSTFTFSGSCNPILYQQAVPVFIDSEIDTWNMDPMLLEDAIKDRVRQGKQKPKAIIMVHLYGMPAKMDEIMSIANQYEIPVIEDAAEALGSKYRDLRLGTFGLLGIYSFNGNKIITTSGGGALVSTNEVMINKARFLATQARDPAPHYQHSEVGYNYRLSNVCAGIGRGQMAVLDSRVESRRHNFELYRQLLSTQPGILFLEEPDGHFSNRWLTTILVDPSLFRGMTREHIRVALEEENIESRPLWKPMHLQPVFEGFPAYVRGASEGLFIKGLCLPSGSNLSSSDLQLVAEKITGM